MLKLVSGGLLALAVVAATAVRADDARTPPTLRLGDGATPLGYEASLAIDPQAETFAGEIRMRFRANRALPVVWMNATRLTIESTDFRQGDRAVAVEVVPGGADFVGFDVQGRALRSGRGHRHDSLPGRHRAREHARDLSPARGERLVRGHAVRGRLGARRAFPCFDEPGCKTPWQLTLDAPPANVVVSNTPRADRRATRRGAPAGSGTRSRRPSRCRRTSSRSPSGPSTSSTAAPPGSKNDAAALPRAAGPRRGGALRARNPRPRLLELLEDYFGTPYPFDKLDTVDHRRRPSASARWRTSG